MAVAVLMQLAWAPRWGVFGARPDLVTLVAVCLGFLDGPQTGAVAGFAGGIALDMLSLGAVGVGALSRTVAGFLAGLVERNIFARSVAMPMVAVAIATAVAQTLELLLLLMLGRQLPIVVSMVRIVIPSALYNGLLAGLVYPLLARVGQRERGRASIEQLG